MGWTNFNWVPYLQGKGLVYYQFFALVTSAASLAVALFFLFLFFAVARLRASQLNYTTVQHSYSSFKLQQILKLKLQYGFLFLFYFFLGFIGIANSSLGTVSNLVGFLTQSFFLYLFVLHLNVQNFLSSKKGVQFYSADLKSKLHLVLTSSFYKTLKSLWVMVSLALLLTIFTSRLCLDFYNDNVGYYNTGLGFGITTQLTRWFTLQKACPPGPPCHFYATLPQSADSSVFVNFHTHKSVKSAQVKVSPAGSGYCTIIDYRGVESLGERNLFNCRINSLLPDTLHTISVIYEGKEQATHKYIPISNRRKKFTMINGGDIGNTKTSAALTRQAIKYAPDLVVLGGDLAYDNNMKHCYYTWDFFLQQMNAFSKAAGRIIPLILAVGNHDVGLNQLPGVNITVTEEGPAYHIYFPQNSPGDYLAQGLKPLVPDLADRRTYFEHRVGPIHYTSLDSGYLHQFGLQQELFLDKVLSQASGIAKFVNYHVPLYSGCRNLAKDSKHFIYATFHWIPLFDKYRVATAYENHVHSFKATKPLRGNGVNLNGTIYLGEGNWGAIPSSHCQKDETLDIFAVSGVQNNVWVTVVQNETIKHRAINANGEVLYEVSQSYS